jgi:plasmid stabilization system protein ParE
MSLRIVLRTEASLDVEQARDYFEQQRPGLGQAFLNRLREVLERIRSAPELYGLVWQNIRAARLRKFTYVVYYRFHRDYVEVLAVMHGSRDSSQWRNRN